MKTIRTGAVAATLLTLALVAAGCGSGTKSTGASGGSGRSGSATTGGTLAIGMGEAATSMNPVLLAPPIYVYDNYDPVIYETASGQFVPDLATSWNYVGSGNKTFEFTLRSGARFSDGTAVTAAAVKNSFEYFLKTNGPNLSFAGPVASITTQGTNTVIITYKSAFPNAVISLTQDWNFGLVIGPKGLASTAALASSSDGAGEYTMQASQTVAGSVYVSTPNKYYFNQAAIKYSRIMVKPFSDPSAELAALQTGQIQFAQNMPATDVATAKSSGMTISDGPSTWVSLMLEDRSSGPLANLKVRQALEYAIDRAAIVKTIYDGYAQVQDQVAIKGLTGYLSSDDNMYGYDPAKAKQLLAAAGYPKGFTLSVLDVGALDKNSVLAQAIASDLAQIGVTVKLTVAGGTFTTLLKDLFSKSYETLVMPSKAANMYFQATQILPTSGSLGNAFGTVNSLMNTVFADAAGASTADQQSTYLQELNHIMNQQAWFVPIALTLSMQFTKSTVQNVPSTFLTTDHDWVSPVTSQNWSGS
jgi:peptide/nickel transport system substrate-binding protein